MMIQKIHTVFDVCMKVGKWAKVDITHFKGVSPGAIRVYKVGTSSPGGWPGGKSNG